MCTQTEFQAEIAGMGLEPVEPVTPSRHIELFPCEFSFIIFYWSYTHTFYTPPVEISFG
jgi:hypothetical protein